MKSFPFISLNQSLTLLRIFTSLLFLAHAIVRITGGTIDRFGGFLKGKGFVYGTAFVWGITAFEIVGGLLLIAGYFKKWISIGFIVMLLIGIIIIHAENGWFVGEHGSGGIEYSAILIVCFIVIAADDSKNKLIS
ncbi:DoxX family protein [Pedobacter foliorum]|uniref:DoxX family protein n=1 Tax=Pedobacter foliorum TaxID=2739058 RepID=UPI001563C064|nr:DoxX family protein [Pedobacter foliorum]NRF40904.1 DoxX family protein [Pedobacter foliorum]